jgi:hypothetical protein
MENFVTKAKRLVAVGTGALMMGATVLGAAVAADLAEYPAPFVENGVWKGLIVVGSDAAASDIVGSVDVAATVSQQAVKVATTTTTTSVAGGVSKDMVLGNYIGQTGQNGFDKDNDNTEMESLADSSLTFQGNSYDYSEHIVLRNSSTNFGPKISTSLTSLGGIEDDYEDNIYLEIERGALGYYYVFDSTIAINESTDDDPLKVTFLGRKMRITDVDDDTSFTAKVGDELFMNVGDTVTVAGQEVELLNVGSNGAVVVSVGGVTETVSGTETVNELEVDVTDWFYSDAKDERSATLTIGTDAVESYTDDDNFVEPCATKYVKEDCKKTNPDWVWDIDDLTVEASGNAETGAEASPGPTIGVINYFVANDFSDDPVTVGGAYDFPLGGYEIQFTALKQDEEFTSLTIEPDSSVDMSNCVIDQTSEESIVLEVDEDEGLITAGQSKKTNRVYLSINDSDDSLVDVCYRDPSDGKIKLDATITSGADVNVAQIDFGDTKSTNVQIDLRGATTENNVTVALDITDDSSYFTEEIHTSWGIVGGEITKMGANANTEEAIEVGYDSDGDGAVEVNLGTKDENHRSLYGIKILDPKSNGASDRARFEIPKDNVEATITLAGPGTVVTTATGDQAVVVQSVAGTAVAKLDTEVVDKTAQPMIIIGGSAVNRLAAELGGVTYPAFGADATAAFGFGANEGTLKLYENAFGGSNVALLVAGWEAENTRDATDVLSDYSAYDLSGMQVFVSPTKEITTVSQATVTS